jgi:hypothetical protein
MLVVLLLPLSLPLFTPQENVFSQSKQQFPLLFAYTIVACVCIFQNGFYHDHWSLSLGVVMHNLGHLNGFLHSRAGADTYENSCDHMRAS